MTDPDLAVPLTLDELRAVTAYALACAEPVLPLFERDHPADARPRAVLDAARAFAEGGRRTAAIRATAFDAHRAAREAVGPIAAEAARAAAHVGGAAYLHPLRKATQGGHILLSAAHAARAAELDGAAELDSAARVQEVAALAGPVVRDVLRRYPPAPPGRGRVGDLWRELDTLLRREPLAGQAADFEKREASRDE